MKILIIEDEPLVAKDLKKLIDKIDGSFEVVATLDSIKKSFDYFDNNPLPDIIFSDIQLSDGVSFEIFKNAPFSCPIIFTTAYNEYAISAFKFNSIDYLLKPIDEEELRNALEKFRKLKENPDKNFANQIQDLIAHVRSENEKRYKSRFTGHLGKSIVAITEEQVAYFTIEELIFLVTLDNRNIVTDYHSLDELEKLVDPSKYLRANRQFLIAFNSIDNVKTHFTGKLNVMMKPPLKPEISVSREKAGEFKKWFEGK